MLASDVKSRKVKYKKDNMVVYKKVQSMTRFAVYFGFLWDSDFF